MAKSRRTARAHQGVRKEKLRAAKERADYIKAAMPSMHKTAAAKREEYLQMQRDVAERCRSLSPPDRRGLDVYPWETTITPPHIVFAEERARRIAAEKAKEVMLSPE